MEIKEKLQKAIKEVLSELNLLEIEIQIEHPENPEHGDYATNIALVVTKRVKQAPIELAERIVNKLKEISSLQPLISNIQIAPPGFINFWLSKSELSRQLQLALKDGERYPSTALRASLKGQTWMVEFAHPNTHKEFHIGHLRNITLGEALCRIFAAIGARVIRTNYQGDVGLHIAKALWAAKLKVKSAKLKTIADKIKFLAQAYVEGSKAYNEDPKARSDIEEINKRLYQGDPDLTQLWKETREWSLEYFDSIYKRLDAKFDRLYFESEVAQPGIDIVKKYLDTVFEKSEGAIIFPGEKYGLHNRVFINKFGFATYEAKDLGLASLQFSEYKPDKIIHVVGPEQAEYFKVLFKALALINSDFAAKEHHLPYGWVRLKTGKMSSRTGEVVVAVWLLDEVNSRLKKTYQMKDRTAEKVAVGAVKYSMLRVGISSEIAFDIDQSIKLDGDSGPYLQYTHARTRSVLRKARESENRNTQKTQKARVSENQIIRHSDNLTFRLSELSEFSGSLKSEELAILRIFYRFPEIIQNSAYQYAPNLVCNFLYDLASKYNLLYNNLPILEPKEETSNKKQAVREFRLALTAMTAQILKTGLNLLGIQAPERM